MSQETNDWSTCATVSDLATAQVLRTYLDAEGIEALIPDENMVAVAWHLGQAIGGVRVQVRSDQVEQAKEILEVVESQGAEEAPEEPDPDRASAGISSGDAVAYRAFKASVMGLVLFFLLPYAFALSLRAFVLGELSRKGRRDAVLGMGISAIAVTALLVTYGLIR